MNKTLIFEAMNHWFEIAHMDGEDDIDSSVLCTRFCLSTCEGCPVHAVTGLDTCHGTPYDAWFNHIIDTHAGYGDDDRLKVHCPKCKELAIQHYLFLRSLLV